MIKILKRYTGVSVMILLCFFSAFMALCNGLMATAQAGDRIKRENQYAYMEELMAYIRLPEEVGETQVLTLCSDVDGCNVYLENMLIYFEEIDGAYRPDLILKQNEPLSLPTRRAVNTMPQGTLITSSKVPGETLTIHGKRFSITQKMDHEVYPFVENAFVLRADDYFEAFPDALKGQGEISLRIAANRGSVEEAYKEIEKKLQEVLPGASIFGAKSDTKNTIFQSAVSMENLVSVGLFLFAGINVVVISGYWVMVRRREIAIRKAFGEGNLRIIRLMAGELLKLIGAAALVAGSLQLLIWQVQGSEISLVEAAILVGGLLFAVIPAILLAMVVPAGHILRIQPSEGVKL